MHCETENFLTAELAIKYITHMHIMICLLKSEVGKQPLSCCDGQPHICISQIGTHPKGLVAFDLCVAYVKARCGQCKVHPTTRSCLVASFKDGFRADRKYSLHNLTRTATERMPSPSWHLWRHPHFCLRLTPAWKVTDKFCKLAQTCARRAAHLVIDRGSWPAQV